LNYLQEAEAAFGQWMNMRDGMFGAIRLKGLFNCNRLIAANGSTADVPTLRRHEK